MGLNGLLNGFSLSFSKLVTLSLNLNTDEKSGSVRNEVVTFEAVGVGVGVSCCGRGLKEIGGRGMVVVKADVILRITETGGKKKRCLIAWLFMTNGGVHQGSNLIVSWRSVLKV
ncbi:hypothetical protein Tco_0503604 [Tanacetum coccineum]